MILRRSILIFVISFLYFFTGCKDNSTDTGGDNPAAITKSPKRGIAYSLTADADLAALSSGVSWWYSWGTNTTAPANYYKTYGMEFIPMLWGGNTGANDIQVVKAFIMAHAEIQYLLVMNEPNLKDQANRTPQQAATDWLRYEQVVSDLAALGRTIYLVGPAMNYGTMAGYSDPVIWLDDFYAAYKAANQGREPKIDYLAFHWYDYGLKGQLDRLQKYGKKIWITEMANWNSQVDSYAKQKIQMADMVNTCETRDDVFRYAWFIGRGSGIDNHYTYLFTNNPGELSELGKYYISLPYKK